MVWGHRKLQAPLACGPAILRVQQASTVGLDHVHPWPGPRHMARLLAAREAEQ